MDNLNEYNTNTVTSDTKPDSGWVPATKELVDFVNKHNTNRQQRMEWIESELSVVKGSS